MRKINLVGNKYGKLLVVGRGETYVSPNGRKLGRWKCYCDCGNTTQVLGISLKASSASTKSCGCLSRQSASKRTKIRNRTHGMSKHSVYHIWHNIKNRCYNQDCSVYKHYGARGIRLYEPWHDLVVFAKWLEDNLGPRPTSKYSLDRIDNDKGYEPGNLRWATKKEQIDNRRKVYSFNETVFAIAAKKLNLSVKQLEQVFQI